MFCLFYGRRKWRTHTDARDRVIIHFDWTENSEEEDVIFSVPFASIHHNFVTSVLRFGLALDFFYFPFFCQHASCCYNDVRKERRWEQIISQRITSLKNFPRIIECLLPKLRLPRRNKGTRFDWRIVYGVYVHKAAATVTARYISCSYIEEKQQKQQRRRRRHSRTFLCYAVSVLEYHQLNAEYLILPEGQIDGRTVRLARKCPCSLRFCAHNIRSGNRENKARTIHNTVLSDENHLMVISRRRSLQ